MLIRIVAGINKTWLGEEDSNLRYETKPSYSFFTGLYFNLQLRSVKDSRLLSGAVYFDVFVGILVSNGHNLGTKIFCP